MTMDRIPMTREGFEKKKAELERMKNVGIEIRAMSTAEFEAFTKAERAKWAKTIDALKVKIE